MSERSRWRPIAIRAVMLIGVAGAYILIGKIQARKMFLGKVDPASRYRCRFTLAPTFQRQDDMARSTSTFTPAPRNPFWKYIAESLLHRPPPATLGIVLEQCTTSPPAPLIVGRDQLFVEQNLQIDKYPATAFDYESSGIDRSFRHMDLYVFLPDRSQWYIVRGYSDLDNAAALSIEMTAILDSFHIERVPVGTGGNP